MHVSLWTAPCARQRAVATEPVEEVGAGAEQDTHGTVESLGAARGAWGSRTEGGRPRAECLSLGDSGEYVVMDAEDPVSGRDVHARMRHRLWG
jgi:hypothetical protein